MGAALPLPSAEACLAEESDAELCREYVEGRVYAMAETTNRHSRVATYFLAAAGARLRGKPCEAFNSDTKARIQLSSHMRFYYPNGMVVCDRNPEDDTFQDRPVVVAEVLSDSTRRLDEGEKRDACLSVPSLKVYLLIDPDRPRVTVWRRGEQGFAAEVYEDLPAVVPLDEVGVELPLGELYERVVFGDASEL